MLKSQLKLVKKIVTAPNYTGWFGLRCWHLHFNWFCSVSPGSPDGRWFDGSS